MRSGSHQITGAGGACDVFGGRSASANMSRVQSSEKLRTACWGQGMATLRETGLKALFSGVTTIEEAVRETVLADRT
jgi:type II secretory ATPase GspE/PulE/Tfp pilus assembly ATPase PilB-like protein